MRPRPIGQSLFAAEFSDMYNGNRTIRLLDVTAADGGQVIGDVHGKVLVTLRFGQVS